VLFLFSKEYPVSDFPAPPRRRGAPNGNQNAVKHGFYSRMFHTTDIEDLDDSPAINLADEIILLRVFIRRAIESNDTQLDFPESLELLRVLSLASLSINRLIRTQHLLTPPGRSMADLHQALAQMIADLKP
jgi:hypothetical protein